MQERIRVYRVTLDTNIFVRATISPRGINAQLLDLWKQGRFVLVLSKDIVGRTQYLVSGDDDLIDDRQLQKTLREYGIRIVDAFDFIREIEAN